MTQTCRYCATQIPAAARKCPQCHAWLARWASPAPRALLLIVFLAVGLGPLFALLYWPVPDFSKHQRELRIIESTFSHQPATSCATGQITLIGTIRNDGNVTWRSPQVEVQYFDRAKTRIDTMTRAEYDLKVRPGQEVHFRILGTAAHEAESYVSHTVTIRNADAVRSWP